MSHPPPWFPLDAELWQTPGPHKLPWYVRKVAVYLRSRADLKDHVVLASIQRIAADTGLSRDKVKLSLDRLRTWPSRRQRFVHSYHLKDNRIVLRPFPFQGKGSVPFVRCYRWLWESPLPDDLKDILLFIRSRFTKKAIDGRELFDCNCYGREQPSILRCCYLKGRHSQARLRRLLNMVRWLEQTGLMVVSPKVSKVLSRLSGNHLSTNGVITEASSGNHLSTNGVITEASSGNHTPKSVTKSLFQSPSSKSVANPAPPGQGQGIPLIPARQLTEYLTRKNELVQLLKACADSKGLSRGKLSIDQSAENFRSLLKSLDPVDRDELLVEDLLWALTSEVWSGMDQALGLRLSYRYLHRFEEELLVSLEIRRKEEWRREQEELRKERAKLERTPEYQFKQALERRYRRIEFGICCEMGDALPHIIWYTCPHLSKEFKPDKFKDEFRCPEPGSFLSPQDIELLVPVWKCVFESESVFDAIEALRSSSDTGGHHRTPGLESEDADLDRRLVEICCELDRQDGCRISGNHRRDDFATLRRIVGNEQATKPWLAARRT